MTKRIGFFSLKSSEINSSMQQADQNGFFFFKYNTLGSFRPLIFLTLVRLRNDLKRRVKLIFSPHKESCYISPGQKELRKSEFLATKVCYKYCLQEERALLVTREY